MFFQNFQGCLLFNATEAMSWHEAQSFCNSISCPNSEEPNSAHLVEIFNQEQQDFMVMKAFEAESFTLSEREWWIGMTDDNSEGISCS